MALLCLCAGLLPALAAAPSDPLAADARLAKAVDLSLKDEPLAELFTRMGRETGVVLQASEDTADERVTLFVRGRPAQEVLARLAEHLDYSWVRETRDGVSRFVLIQDQAAKQRQAALGGGAAADAAALRKTLEAQAHLLESPESRQAARKPHAQRIARLRALEERLTGARYVVHEPDGAFRTERRRPAPLLPRERQALERELELLRRTTLGHSGSFDGEDSAAWLYALLSPKERRALWTGAPLRFAFPPERGRLAIPRETAHELGQGSLGTLGGGFEEGAERDVPAPMTALERMRGELALQRRGGRIQLHVRLRVLGSYVTADDEQRVERVFRETVEQDLLSTEPSGPPLDACAQALRDPITLRAEPLPPGQIARTDFADLLEQLATQVPYPILADGYLAVLHRQITAERQPLAQVLREPCRGLNRHCRYDRGYLTFRARDWAIIRGLEPPARRVRRWETELAAHGALRLRTLAEIAEHCTAERVPQLRYRWSRRTPEGVHLRLEQELAQSEALLQLLHSLPAGAWRSLEAGRLLPARSLSPSSQSRLRQVLLDATDRGYEATGEVSLANLIGVPGGGFHEEDRQDAVFAQTTLALQRRPASWFITSFGFHPIEQLEQALKLERERQPRATERDLQRVDGERVQVLVTQPGAQLVLHAFLVSSSPTPEHGDRR